MNTAQTLEMNLLKILMNVWYILNINGEDNNRLRRHMRSVFLIGIGILLLSGVACAGGLTLPADAPTSDIGYIYVWSNPAEGDIYVDGNYEGTTDSNQYITIYTTPGYHTVEIYKDGYEDYSTSAYVYSDQDAYVIADLTSNQTNWMLVSAILVMFLIGAIVLMFPKSKESVQRGKLSHKYKVSMIALITCLIIAGIAGSFIKADENLAILLCYIFLILVIVLILGLIRRFWNPKEIVWAVGIVFVFEILLISITTLVTDDIHTTFLFAIIAIPVLFIGWVGGVFWIIQEWNLKIQYPIVKSQPFDTEVDDAIDEPTKAKTSFTPKSKASNGVCFDSASKTEPKSESISQRNRQKVKPVFGFKKTILLIILLTAIVIGSFGYTVYSKYSPLAELEDCGTNCIDYKKIQITDYETPVPDIKITEVDAEKMIMDVPIIIYNPSTKDTETVKIDFDIYMEGKHLTKGTIPTYELPAKQNTTMLIKDVVIKDDEFEDVLLIVAETHGIELVKEGKANISMTSDLLIYFPINVFSINIYTFIIPVQIETEVPVDMLKQNEEVKKQIEEKVKMAIMNDELDQLYINETEYYAEGVTSSGILQGK